MNKESTIASGQLFFLIIKFEIGVDILSLPYQMRYLFKQKSPKKAVPFVVLASCCIAYLPQRREDFELIGSIANNSAYIS
ncbi:hypothetical protein MF628_004601 [Paenibacillus polymyxa]|uniref:hypothetical protein n=1 Tax=Paenibacillus polymyxa TaxID=1406 RepID=UPI002023E38C|nr:hypothetical protein [Paenibacillus polymyxa]URJ44840.1 hypothetical protein MF628_004601 [Paenibacillus polymyxa]